MNVIDPALRLSKVEFEADQDWRTYPRSEYRCADCDEVVAFNLQDLDRHWLQEFTNLAAEDANTAAEEAKKANREFNSFIDFYCRGCRKPVRICYMGWAGGRYTHGHSIRFVLEGAVPNSSLQPTAPEAGSTGRRGG